MDGRDFRLIEREGGYLLIKILKLSRVAYDLFERGSDPVNACGYVLAGIKQNECDDRLE